MAMTDQRPRETHLAASRYVNTSRTATSAIKAAAVAAGIVTASVAVPMATPPIAAHAAPASAVQSLASLDGPAPPRDPSRNYPLCEYLPHSDECDQSGRRGRRYRHGIGGGSHGDAADRCPRGAGERGSVAC